MNYKKKATMKYIAMGALALLTTITACEGTTKKTNSVASPQTGSDRIDTITVRNDDIESLFFDEFWVSESLNTLRQYKVPCEVIVVANKYSEIQDSMLTFTADEFRYSFMKVVHTDRIFLEYFEEHKLDSRIPVIKGMSEKLKQLADEMENPHLGNYAVHGITEYEMSDVFLDFRNEKLVGAKYIGFID